MDIVIVDVGAVSEGGDGGVGLLLNEREHVFICLSEVVGGGDIWERCAVWEPFGGESISGAVEFRYETVEASIVVHGWSDLRTMNAMRRGGFMLIWYFMDKDSGAQWCKWYEIKSEGSKYCCPC